MIAVCRSRRDFRRIESEGRTRRGRVLWVRAVTDRSTDECRVAYATGRRLGGAVVRNRVRRRLRAIVARRSAMLPDGLVLIGASPGASGASFAELETDLAGLLERLDADVGAAPAEVGR